MDSDFRDSFYGEVIAYFVGRKHGLLLCHSDFTAPGVGLFAVASVYYVNAVTEKQDAIKGQAYMTATYSLGCIIAAAAGGELIDSMGVDAMLFWAVAASFGGMVILLFAASNTQKEDVRSAEKI